MAVKIASEFTNKTYIQIAEALKNGWRVSILEEQILKYPLSSLDAVYVNVKNGGRHIIESSVIFDSPKNAIETQIFARKVLETEYKVIISGNNDYRVELDGGMYIIKHNVDDHKEALSLNTSEKSIDPYSLRKNITNYLTVLEKLIDSGYSFYKIPHNQQFPTVLKVNKGDSTDEKHEKKNPKEEEITLKAISYIPREELTTGFEDIGGCDAAKDELKRYLFSITNPVIFQKVGAVQPRGILLYGPPGTGKTLIASATAKEGNVNFLKVDLSQITNEWYGRSEKNVKEIFKIAEGKAPSVLFMDEMDSLFIRRDITDTDVGGRVVGALLDVMDGIKKPNGVLVMGATNRPDILDPALLRPGRFDRLVEVPMPDLSARKRIFEIQVSGREIDRQYLREDLDYDVIAKASEGLSGADAKGVLDEATYGLVDKLIAGIEPDPIDTEEILECIARYTANRKKIKQVMPTDIRNHLYV